MNKAVARDGTLNTAETQYQVVWFPPSSPDKIKAFRTLADAQAFAESVIDAYPVIQSRTVTVSEWALVENLADRAQP